MKATKTVITLTVYSREPIDMSLSVGDILERASTREFIASAVTASQEPVDGDALRAGLKAIEGNDDFLDETPWGDAWAPEAFTPEQNEERRARLAELEATIERGLREMDSRN